MKAQLKLVVTTGIIFVCPVVWADMAIQKPTPRIDFNRIIDQNKVQGTVIHQEMNTRLNPAAENTTDEAEVQTSPANRHLAGD